MHTNTVPPLPAHLPALRAQDLPPFHVMELLARAQALQAQGRDIIHMEVGEPDFPTPAPIIEAAQQFLAGGRVDYTPAAGLPALREAIAQHYAERFGVDISPSRILVTAGASGALMLAHAVLTNPGEEWLLPDPGYPCNRQFVRAFSGIPMSLSVDAASNFQPTAASVAAAWTPNTRGLMIASPANPTGTLIAEDELARIHSGVTQRSGTHGCALIVDEIYQGLVYDQDPRTALKLDNATDDIFVVNSFSKYFGMTGWRLGWLVAPERYVRELEKLAQHYTICAPTPAQHAALAAFKPETIAILEQRRAEFAERRKVLLAGLNDLGFKVPATPQGAFYVWADVSGICEDSAALAHRLLEEAGVATTPGIDFAERDGKHWLRLAYTTDIARIREALERLGSTLGT